jgi:hypothetical protein
MCNPKIVQERGHEGKEDRGLASLKKRRKGKGLVGASTH